MEKLVGCERDTSQVAGQDLAGGDNEEAMFSRASLSLFVGFSSAGEGGSPSGGEMEWH